MNGQKIFERSASFVDELFGELSYQLVRSADDEQAIGQALRIFESDPHYVETTSGETIDEAMVRENVKTRPPNTKTEQKCFLLILRAGEPVAILDIIMGFPESDCFYVGLLLVDKASRSRGLGEAIYTRAESLMAEQGFLRARLGVLENNDGGLRFWKRLGFDIVKTAETEIVSGAVRTVYVMEKRVSKA